jgi:hypothetical protein
MKHTCFLVVALLLAISAARCGAATEPEPAFQAARPSCNHGFASHAAHVLFRDVLGLREVDRLDRTVTLRFGDVKLERCAGSTPTADGPIALEWRRTGEQIVYRVATPPGYRVTVRNDSGKTLVKEAGNPALP